MKTIFIVEADTELYSLFAYRAEYVPDASDFIVYRRKIDIDADVQQIDPSKFYGQLNALLPTWDTINHAPKMELAAPNRFSTLLKPDYPPTKIEEEGAK
jgi:hypothetical protein